ncbi:MAG: ABC transporter permease [Candidatus Palauibacterales bacterium]|nr:ABC transporter permease [Candidatus Palauibacterales bacterium]MDP2482400.1 ABC transporter permease [Candidatus Palauibacterales bacterium]
MNDGSSMASVANGSTPVPVLRIEPSRGWVSLKLRELWEYRELLYFLTWRDIKVRYKQSVLGVSWAIIQPFVSMVVFTVFFGKLANLGPEGVPYPIWNYAAMVVWTYFAFALTQSSNSLVTSSALLKKIYFPRLVVPIAATLSGLVDFFIAMAVLIPMMLFYGYAPTLNTLWLIPLILLTFVTAFGVGLWFSALNVQFRDVKHGVPFLVQIWFFATPIVYSATDRITDPKWLAIYSLNPMVGVSEGFRWALLGLEPHPGPMILVSAVVSATIFVGGLFYFRRMEKTFADVV